MIFFHTIPIKNEMMAVVEGGCIAALHSFIEFTIFGYAQHGIYLSGLFPDENVIPQECLLNDTESGFDYYYWNQLSNSELAKQCLGSILFPEYQYGPNVAILISVSDSPFSMSITESIIKYLNIMYGLTPKLITSIEDLYDTSTYEYTPFSAEGVMRVTADMVRYTAENQTELSFIPEE